LAGQKGARDLGDSTPIRAFFDALDRLDVHQLERLRSEWRSIPKEIHEAAWAQVRTVAGRDGMVDEVDRVRRRALDWTTRGSRQPGRGQPDYRAWIELKIGAAEPIVDAALAFALGDRLDETSRTTLLGPWRATTDKEYPRPGA
jgi:hypothetical protein